MPETTRFGRRGGRPYETRRFEDFHREAHRARLQEAKLWAELKGGSFAGAALKIPLYGSALKNRGVTAKGLH
jgi:hypothetical protein